MEKRYIINDITSGLSVNIIRGRLVQKTEDWKEHKTKFDYTLWNIIEGEVHIKINGNEFIAKEGDAVMFYPGDSYTAWGDSGCKFLFIYFELKMGQGLDLLSHINLPGIIPHECIGRKNMSFCKEFAKKYTVAQHATLELYALFLNYLSDLLSAALNNNCIRFYSKLKNKSDSDMWKVIDYIEQHSSENLKVKQIAAVFNLSEKHFITKFRSIIGIPPREYITQSRMKKAAELIITDSGMKISEIAHTLGYPDQYTFSKAFKKYYGESPSEFRKFSSVHSITVHKHL